MPPIPPDQIGAFGGANSVGAVTSVPLAYRIRDAERVSGISKSSLYELAARGELTLSRVAGRTLVPADELRRLIDKGRSRAA